MITIIFVIIIIIEFQELGYARQHADFCVSRRFVCVNLFLVPNLVQNIDP